MNDNLDDWLSSLEAGNPANETTQSALPDSLPESSISSVEVPNQQSPSQSLSDQDFDDILSDFGFTPPETADAEEVSDEEEDYDENGGEGRDLDAEEDADWDNAFEQGLIREVDVERAEQHTEEEVHFHMPNGDVVDVPIIQEEAAVPSGSPEVSEGPILPLNSPTLLLDESTTRFSGAEWYNEIQRQSIIVAGVGGIGSNLCFQLARMHPASLFMYDDDTVEAVNMAGQLYARNDIGKSKVAAMTDMITGYTNMQNIYAIQDRFTSNTEAGHIMMCGFDNMEARKTFYLRWQEHVGSLSEDERKKCLFLDGRLSIDTLQVFCLTGDDVSNMERYSNEYLFSDSEAEHTQCSMKQTTYLACMIGSVMTNLFTNFVANQLDPIIPYDLPFFTEYDAQNMIFKTVK